MVRLTAFAIPRAEYFLIRRAGQPQSQHRKIHYHQSVDEKTKILIVVRRLKNAKLWQQIRSVVYNQEYYLQNVINKQKYPNRTNLPDKQGEYAKLFILRLYPQAAAQRLRS